jgi:hypothetical protein
MAMTEYTIELAGKRIRISGQYNYTKKFCEAYLCENTEPDFTVVVTQSDIEFERAKSAAEDALEGIPVRQFYDRYLETLAVYRKIAELLIEDNILLFHGSAIAVDGEAFLFTAKSGTGKSTHTRLWRETFGDRAVMVNDDKPLLLLRDGKVWVCGTPWDGKHRLSTNTIVPLSGICILERGEKNAIAPVSAKDALPAIFEQSYRPANLGKLLEVVEILTQSVDFYRLQCNMDPEAAQVAYNGMRKERKTSMKLKQGFVTREMGGEQIMVATGKANFSGFTRANAAGAFIVNCLKEETSVEKIVDAMAAVYDAPRDVLEADVLKIIEKLRSIGAIDE